MGSQIESGSRVTVLSGKFKGHTGSVAETFSRSSKGQLVAVATVDLDGRFPGNWTTTALSNLARV